MEQQVQERQVTCLLTSCNRFDLLRITLESFLKFNTYNITAFWVYEDSGVPVPDDLKNDFPFIQWIEQKERKGQIVALDTLWSKCSTHYAFMMEDDWETYHRRHEVFPRTIAPWRAVEDHISRSEIALRDYFCQPGV